VEDDDHGSPTCVVCGHLVFPSFREQRDHFRSDWHLYNVRQRRRSGLRGGRRDHPGVSEEEFLRRAVASELSSISGSENEDSTDEDNEDREIRRRHVQKTTSGPRLDFRFRDGDGMVQRIRVWKASLVESESLPSALGLATCAVDYALLMMYGGGHFAGGVFEAKTGHLVAHKTIHRCTTRRKQGGAQNFSEKAARAQSAGASLRRAIEQRLKEEAAEAIKLWTKHFQSHTLVFL